MNLRLVRARFEGAMSLTERARGESSGSGIECGGEREREREREDVCSVGPWCWERRLCCSTSPREHIASARGSSPRVHRTFLSLSGIQKVGRRVGDGGTRGAARAAHHRALRQKATRRTSTSVSVSVIPGLLAPRLGEVPAPTAVGRLTFSAYGRASGPGAAAGGARVRQRFHHPHCHSSGRASQAREKRRTCPRPRPAYRGWHISPRCCSMSTRALVSARVDLGSGRGLGFVWVGTGAGHRLSMTLSSCLHSRPSVLSPSPIGPAGTAEQVSSERGRCDLADAYLT